MINPALEALLARPDIRCGGEANRSEKWPTGFAALDASLGGGWPSRGLVEVLHAEHGGGELSLFAPLYRTLTAAERQIVFVAPPFPPHAPALARWSLASNLMLLDSRTAADSLWAAETCLRAGCGAVLCWLARLTHRALRRLQLAAEDGRALALLFRPARESTQPSPAVLRLTVQRANEGVTVNLLKCRGRPASTVRLADQQIANSPLVTPSPSGRRLG
ncbi:MAG TPA: translesion DNA synthesis-associated protein ImuA [Gammaproteobacteria bacterium]|nr:translesion DNA synthesis-associated protein ImuA [Gammaproteobacteria bacterium]